MAVARAWPPPRCILPKIKFDAEGGMVGIAMPDDPDYDSLD